VYTSEEHEYNQRSCIIAPDAQIPNSIVRQTLSKINRNRLAYVSNLSNELDIGSALQMSTRSVVKEEPLTDNWNDTNDEQTIQRQQSPIQSIIDRQRNKRRTYDDEHNQDKNSDALPLNEIINGIRTNIGKDLQPDEILLINEFMQTISQHKQEQVLSIYEELMNLELIEKNSGMPKLRQVYNKRD
jgi:hypothetical protein